MFSITDLPRSDDGLVHRDFIAKHASASFTLEGYGFKFVDGVTVEPVTGRTCDRLCAAYGSDVTFVPCSREVGEDALAWMKRHQVAEQRIGRLSGELDALFLVAKTEPVKKPSVPAPPVSKSFAPEADILELDADTTAARPKGKSGK